MKHLPKIGLFLIALTLLIGSIAFCEMGHFLFGLLMVAGIIIAVFYIGSLFEDIKAYKKLAEVYKGAEEIYKDSLKNARKHNEELNEIVSKTLECMEHMNGSQAELNSFMKETLAARRIDNITIAAGYEELQKKISRSMKTSARKR